MNEKVQSSSDTNQVQIRDVTNRKMSPILSMHTNCLCAKRIVIRHELVCFPYVVRTWDTSHKLVLKPMLSLVALSRNPSFILFLFVFKHNILLLRSVQPAHLIRISTMLLVKISDYVLIQFALSDPYSGDQIIGLFLLYL